MITLVNVGSGPNAGDGDTLRAAMQKVNTSLTSLRVRDFVSKAVDYAVGADDEVILVTATGKTMTLPTAVGVTGKTYTIKLSASGSSTIATTSAQTIDGASTYSLSAQYKFVTVLSNGANWIIIGAN